VEGLGALGGDDGGVLGELFQPAPSSDLVRPLLQTGARTLCHRYRRQVERSRRSVAASARNLTFPLTKDFCKFVSSGALSISIKMGASPLLLILRSAETQAKSTRYSSRNSPRPPGSIWSDESCHEAERGYSEAQQRATQNSARCQSSPDLGVGRGYAATGAKGAEDEAEVRQDAAQASGGRDADRGDGSDAAS
jgi:hypothetical protein